MLKVTIEDKNGSIWQENFQTQEEANAWVQKQMIRPGFRPDEATYKTVVDKSNLLQYVDVKTSSLIRKGFKFKEETFSMSMEAQKNWSDIYIFRDLLTWPVEVSTKNDGSFMLERTDLDAFIVEAISFKKSLLDSGRDLKKKIKKAKTLNDLKKIEDKRG
jgi:hypothetical protein